MAIRVDYKEIEEVSQRVPVPLKHSENLRNFEGEVGGYPTPCDIATGYPRRPSGGQGMP
jgi:hypothetical protein